MSVFGASGLVKAMKRIRDLPIRQKLLVMTLVICGAVLCVAIAALFVFQVMNFRSRFERDTATLAVVIANNSTAAMAFKDEQAANEVVGALRAEPTVLSATLVLPGGSVFAHYGSLEDARGLAQFPIPGEPLLEHGHLLVTQPITLKREQVGVLYVRSDYRHTFLALLSFYGWVAAGILAVSITLAGFLSPVLGRSITTPLLELARTAIIVGERKEYSVRADVGPRRDELGLLADSFNEMLGRIQSQDAALSLSQRKMEALINSIDGIVWECAPDTFRSTFVSRQSQDILGYQPEDWLSQPNFWETKLDPQDAAKALRVRQEMAVRAQPYTHEYRMRAADGRVVWIRESGTVLTENGKPAAMRGIFLDVTRAKSDAAELDKLNRQLMGTSRLAGMAEVATGVLHNVGNVLNSLSVSATAVADRLRRSKIANLRRATALLREQNGRLAEFLTNDPKGQLLPEYVEKVSGQLENEYSEMLVKMESLGQHIEHIKEIVAMQQNYAKVSGVYENLPLVPLVEDALRMNAAAFERHSIEVVREFSPELPLVRVDRHKALQILINLIRNAKYAMDAGDPPHKRLVVKVTRPSSERALITIADNGVGIAPEHLTRIFNHGFTTRSDGHGFGLHSGANAAREMGGSLTAQSEGPGKGAEFNLELPATAQPDTASIARSVTS
jgi:PAS domain S-box-containing protein